MVGIISEGPIGDVCNYFRDKLIKGKVKVLLKITSKECVKCPAEQKRFRQTEEVATTREWEG